jgi:hypothetical protein
MTDTGIRLAPLSNESRQEYAKCEATSNRLSIDAELIGEVGLLLACASAAADPFEIRVSQFDRPSHNGIVLSWDITWDITVVTESQPGQTPKPAVKPKSRSTERKKVTQGKDF